MSGSRHDPSHAGDDATDRLQRRRAAVDAVRAQAKSLFDGGSTGIQVAAAISEGTDEFVKTVFRETVERLPSDARAFVARNAAVVAVGGTGRGELCPYSDVDLLFLIRPTAKQAAGECVSQAVRDYWDAGLRLGHAVRSVVDTVNLARQEADVATSLVEARLLSGDPDLYATLTRQFRKKVVRPSLSAFIDGSIAAREKERTEHGSAVKQLEPDVKRSPGGLRDLHLLRWVGFARFGAADVESLRLLGALNREEARILLTAYEFLMRVRIDLHFSAGRSQDVLTRDDQLRIADERRIEGTFGQRPVERFMQTYFRHSTTIAEICERFITLHRPRAVFGPFLRSLVTHRSEGVYVVGGDSIDVLPRHRESVLSSLEGILAFYRAAARYRTRPSAEFTERIREAGLRLKGDVSPKSAQLFLDILGCHGNLGAILRSMFRTGVLEIVVPAAAHARCLLQFNQYHSFTVDEHTLRAIEAVEEFEHDPGPLGAAYRAIRKKHVLHLALLLHDLGKGFEEDHSNVGRAIADRTAARLSLADEDHDTLVFLVHKHLNMAHQAFRRDTSDPEAVVEFSREVGSAETLRMLFVLTAADVMAVGPGVWTEWKAELLNELYDRALLLLSGQDAAAEHEARLSAIRNRVTQIWATDDKRTSEDGVRTAAETLDKFPSHYLSTTPPERIAADLQRMRTYRAGDVIVEGRFDPETETVDYRIITHEDDVRGCFHKVAGALTANRLEIISAQIATASDGFVVDSFRVHDGDFSGTVPPQRIEEVAAVVKSALSGRASVEELFQRQRRFNFRGNSQPISGLPSRVVIDNTSSDRFTVIDVFSHDRPGLLYTVSRRIFELELSVVLAKIATHLDQVVDVFYVTDREGRKLNDPARLKQVQIDLSEKLDAFEHHERLQFAS